MSDNYPYRPVPDTDLRPALGTYSSSSRRHVSPHIDFHRPHQEPPPPSHLSSFSSTYPSSSSSRGSAATTLPLPQGSVDGALGILNSCGLEPSDLSLLAELPESLLTVDSLPRLLQQLKGKRGMVNPSPHNAPSCSSSSSSSYSASVVRHPAGKWDLLHSQPVQYPLGHVPSVHLPSEQVQDCWGKQTSSSVSYTPSSRSELPPPSSSSSSSSSSRHFVDSHRASSSDYGKTARDASTASSQDQRSFRSSGRSRESHFSQPNYRSVPPTEAHHQRPWQGRRESEVSSSRSSSSSRVPDTRPSTKGVLDFHGTMPVVYPYSCSLCDITVLSEKVWIQHVNSTQHADGQLNLLQQFPNWDCRMETVNRADKQSQKTKDEAIPTQLPQPANQKSKPHSIKKPQKKVETLLTVRKTSEKGKVACVKFPHQSVDEAYLRKLSEPFGKVVKILIFPSLAFVEMGSIDQVKDLVKFHNNYPPTVNGVQMDFSISDTFNFLQSSRVVSFSPAPTGEDGQSDLLSIVKRFGQPLYTLFLPSMAYVEMKNAVDAEKLVDYYSSNTLRVNKDQIKVSFSGEYKVLMRVPSAKRYEETSMKRMKSPSRDHEEKTTQSKRTRSSSRDDNRDDKTIWSDTMRSSRSNEEKTRSSTERRSRSREKSSSRSSEQNRSRERRSGSRERRSRSREKRSKSREINVVPEKPIESKPESESEAERPVIASEPEAGEKESSEAEAESSAEESDIEGMEVIGEDGETLEDEDLESHDDDDVGEENEEEDLQDEKKEEKDAEEGDQEKKEEEELESKSSRGAEEKAESQLEDEEEPDFPVDLENCITLDEVEESNEPDEPGICVAEEENRDDPEGFIEMSSCSDAAGAVAELSHQSVSLNDSKLNVTISQKYSQLTSGSMNPWDMDKTTERASQNSSSKSNISESDEPSEGSGGRKESPKNTLDREATSEKCPQIELDKCKTAEEDLCKDKTSSEVQPVCKKETPDSGEKIPEESDSPADFHRAESEEKAAAGPAEDTVSHLKPSKPVGTEFVRPVVGYFCNLCQVIYADEDEAKLQHCSSLSHYNKYQEITGKDPWTC